MQESQRITPPFRYARGVATIARMQKKTIHTILADLLAQANIKPTELAARTGVPQSTISRILNRKILAPKDEPVRKLANYFGVTTDQLRGFQPLSSPYTDHSSAKSAVGSYTYPFSVWDDGAPLGEDEVEVPFLREVELAAGSGSTVIRESNGYLRFSKQLLLKKGVQPESAVVVVVTGNSMEPVLLNGATVGVDRGRTDIVDGDMYAIDHGGQLRVKHVYRIPGGGMRLRSFNRDEHPDEEYRLDQIREQEITVIGRVFCWSVIL